MTNKQMQKQINNTADAARKAGQTISIDWGLPYVSIVCSESDEYFFQGEEASNLLAEAVEAGNKFYVSSEDYLLHIAQGW